jgi:hypothetical protein
MWGGCSEPLPPPRHPPRAASNTHPPRKQFMTKQTDDDNHANQMNPNNDEYWHSRDEDERPDDWEERAEPAQTD